MSLRLESMGTPIIRAACICLPLLVTLNAQEPSQTLQIERKVFVLEGGSSRLAWSPDGKTLASGGDQGDVSLLAYPSGRHLRTLEASDHWIGELVFSPDSAQLAVSGRDLSLWSVADGKLLGRYPSISVRAMDWSRDGSVLACIGRGKKAASVAQQDHERRLTLLDPEDLTEVRSFPLFASVGAGAIALNRDGSRIALGGSNGVRIVLDSETGREISRRQTSGNIQGLHYSEDGELWRLGWDGEHRLFDGKRHRFGKRGYSFRVQADGSRAIIRSNDQVGLFRRDGETTILNGSGAVALHPDGVHWARVLELEVEVYEGDRAVSSFPVNNRLWPRGLVLAEGGRVIAVTDGSRAYLVDAETGASIPSEELPAHRGLVANPGGSNLVLHRPWDGSADGALEFWRLLPEGPRLEREEQLPGLKFGTPVLSRSERVLGFDKTIVHRKNQVRTVEVDEFRLNTLVPDPEGEMLAGIYTLWGHVGGVSSLAANLYLYDLDGEELFYREIGSGINDLAFRPDGVEIAISTEKELLIFDRSLQLVWSRPCRWAFVEWLDSETLVGSSTSSGVFMFGAADKKRDVPTLEVVRKGMDAPMASLELDGFAGALDLDRELGRIVLAQRDHVLVVRLDF